MVQQNGNKQHFTIYSATPSNAANTTLESIYHTFKFDFSVRPEVKLDVHPFGLDRICEHPCATKHTAIDGVVCESIIAETNAPR